MGTSAGWVHFSGNLSHLTSAAECESPISYEGAKVVQCWID